MVSEDKPAVTSAPGFSVPVPLYVQWHKNAPVIRTWPPLLVASGFMALVVGAWELLNATGLRHRTALEALCLYGVAALAASGFVLLSWAYRETRKATGAIRRILRSDNQFRRLERDLARMFGRRVQGPFAIGGVVVLLPAVVFMDPGVALFPYCVLLVLAIIGAAILGYGFGLAAMTMYWVHSLPSYGAMNLFILPSYTPALRVASRLTGLFALLFVVQASASIALFVAIPWRHEVMVNVVTWGVAFPVALLGVAICFYPQFAIRRIIVKRRRILVATYAQIYQTNASVVDAGACDTLVQVSDLCARLQSSPSFALDFGTAARFVASLAIGVWATLNYAVGEEGIRQGFWGFVKVVASVVTP